MEIKTFVEQVEGLLGEKPVGISLTAQAADVFDVLGAGWLAAALRTQRLVSGERAVRAELHFQNAEPMRNLAETGWSARDGLAAVGRGTVLNTMHIAVPSPELFSGESTFSFGNTATLKGRILSKVYTGLYNQVPLFLDSYRQWRNTKTHVAPHFTQHVTAVAADAHEASNDRVMWVAMHWAETGGAESWAWEQARIAHEAGFELVLTFDRAAPQRLLDRAYALTPHVYLVGNSLEPHMWGRFAEALVEHHGITDVHIHHSQLAYETIPLLRLAHPYLRVEDTTHITEHRGGGFVRTSIENSAAIDLHHVISPQLVEVYEQAGIDSDKVVLHPLIGFTLDENSVTVTDRIPAMPLRVGFLGRFSAQKRPYLFQRVAAYMNLRHPGDAVFIMQGAGELAPMIDRDERRLKLADVVERRGWAPSEDLLSDIDVLLVTSDNEGLTLTTLEADALGVLVVSSDVGSQRDVIADGALFPREPLPFMKQASNLLSRLSGDPHLYSQLLAEQHRKISAIRGMESATEFYTRHYQEELVK